MSLHRPFAEPVAADRAGAHRVDDVDNVLRRFRVLRLHGPARYPHYYGQLQRQNREHRAWLQAVSLLPLDELPAACDRMRTALNDSWHRATLGWRTATDLGTRRPPLLVDRQRLADDVHLRTERLRWTLDGRRSYPDLPERLAIEQALAQRGLLRRHLGGWRQAIGAWLG